MTELSYRGSVLIAVNPFVSGADIRAHSSFTSDCTSAYFLLARENNVVLLGTNTTVNTTSRTKMTGNIKLFRGHSEDQTMLTLFFKISPKENQQMIKCFELSLRSLRICKKQFL